MCGYTMHRFYILYTEQSIKIVHMLLPPIYYHRYLLARVQGEFDVYLLIEPEKRFQCYVFVVVLFMYAVAAH